MIDDCRKCIKASSIGVEAYIGRHSVWPYLQDQCRFVMLSWRGQSQHEFLPVWPGAHHFVYQRLARRIITCSDRSAHLYIYVLPFFSFMSIASLTTSTR